MGTQPDGGDCPDTHPVRLPMLFFEILFSVDLDEFPHGEGVQPFRLACGDATGKKRDKKEIKRKAKNK
jgi:hypothetical protein